MRFAEALGASCAAHGAARVALLFGATLINLLQRRRSKSRPRPRPACCGRAAQALRLRALTDFDKFGGLGVFGALSTRAPLVRWLEDRFGSASLKGRTA